MSRQTASVIGGGPAGLIAAETLAQAGLAVTLYDRNPSVGRKFLMAGRGGLNLTHSEPLEGFLGRYGAARDFLAPLIALFTPSDLRDWAAGLGQQTFVGSSGRVFPESMKASPLLRAWLTRLTEQGVQFRSGYDWHGEDLGTDATVLTLGGASYPRLGSDGGWVGILAARGVAVSPLRPANCGFHVKWSDVFRERFQGQPLKNVALSFAGRTLRGEIMITASGIEGGAVYALSASLRDSLPAVLEIDLCPDIADLPRRLSQPRRGQSQSNFLRKALGLSPLAINLLREANMPAEQAHAVPLTLTATSGLERAISTAGGIALDELDENLMLKKLPGIFAAGEMLDWEAPTGGYLLQASFATGLAAARGVLNWLKTPDRSTSPRA